MTMRIGAKVPNSGPLPARLGIGRDGRRAGGGGVRVALGQRPHRAPEGDRVAVPVRRGRARHVGHRHAVCRCPDRAGADRRGDRARDDRDGGARAAVAAARRVREAGGVDRRRERRPAAVSASAPAGSRRSSTPSTSRSRVAAGGSKSGSRSLVPAGRARPAPSRPELYDLPPGVLCLPTPAHDIPLLDRRPFARRSPSRRADRRRLARAAGAARAGPGRAHRADRDDAGRRHRGRARSRLAPGGTPNRRGRRPQRGARPAPAGARGRRESTRSSSTSRSRTGRPRTSSQGFARRRRA